MGWAPGKLTGCENDFASLVQGNSVQTVLPACEKNSSPPAEDVNNTPVHTSSIFK